MESSLSTFLSGPGRYIAIICIAYLLIGLPLTMLYLKKNKIMAKSYLPGKNIIEAEASWTRKGLMKTITTTTGPIKIEVEAEAKKTYILKYDTEENNFIFEEFIGEEEK